MSKHTPSADESAGSLNSLLSKREAAVSIPASSRPPSASSSGSFQMIPNVTDILTPATAGISGDLKRESVSGGGFTGEKNNEGLRSILVDSKLVSSSKKTSSSTTPRSTLFQLYFITSKMYISNDICGGNITSKQYDAFCAKATSTCTLKTHQENKHRMYRGNTIFICGKTLSAKSGTSDKIFYPNQYYLEVEPKHIDTAKGLLRVFSQKYKDVKNFETAGSIFNNFCEEYNSAIGNTQTENSINPELNELDLKPSKRDSETGLFKTIPKTLVSNPDQFIMDDIVNNKKISSLFNNLDNENYTSADSSVSSHHSKDSDLSDESELKKFTNSVLGTSDDIDESYIRRGMQFGIDFDKDPTRQVSLLGAFLLKQEDTILKLTKTVEQFASMKVVSPRQLTQALSPLQSNVKATIATVERNKSSFDRYKRRHAEDNVKAKVTREVTKELSNTFEERFNAMREEMEALETDINQEAIQSKLQSLENKLIVLESTPTSSGSLFPTTSVTSPLIPDIVRSNMASIEFKLALLESRVGAQTLQFGTLSLKSLVDTELFVNDHVPSFSYGCFFDLVALLDSLRDTTTTEKSFLESEYNAQKTKFVSVDEASTSASFLHVAPLVFCGNSSSVDSKYGSIERSLPNVKTREHWVSLGGMEGMKRQLEEEVSSKVGSILEEIPMTLGESQGAYLAKTYLQSSQNCFHKFVTWTETFFQELLGNSQVTEKEAWVLILHCWMAFFSDLRQIRMACSNLSPGRHDVGSEGRTKIVARYVWTMGRAIILQNEYCAKQFRNHPSIATVINYHLFQHRVPMTLYKTTVGKLDSEVKGINAWKAQIGRELKEVRKLATDRS